MPTNSPVLATAKQSGGTAEPIGRGDGAQYDES
jgi:hypothetical protein